MIIPTSVWTRRLAVWVAASTILSACSGGAPAASPTAPPSQPTNAPQPFPSLSSAATLMQETAVAIVKPTTVPTAAPTATLLPTIAPTEAMMGTPEEMGTAEGMVPEVPVDRSKLAKELHLYNWSEYIDETIFDDFQKEYGVKVIEDNFASNEEMIAKLRAGNPGYDLIVPSDYAVEILAKENLLLKLDKSLIPNLQNINPANLKLYYDPNNDYTAPYQWGTTGIAYNTKNFPQPPDSSAVLFDPKQVCKYKGKVSMLDDEREVIGAALRYKGYSVNDTDPAHLKEVEDILLKQKDCLAGYNSDNFNETLAAEEVVLAHAWSGGAALATQSNENIAYFIPKEGGVIWQDNIAIPKGAPNAYTANVFINFLLRPDEGAKISEYTLYLTPNNAAKEALSDDVKELLAQFEPDDATRQRLEWLKKAENTTIYSDVWTRVKSK